MLVITGGGGFVGSVLVAHLNEMGRVDLVLVDRFGTGEKWRNIAKRDFFEIVPIEMLFDWLDRFGEQVDGVVHLGANSSTKAANADEIIADNLNASIALWRWCVAARKTLIYASSAATYGAGEAGFDDRGGIADFKRLRPLNLYGWSKHAFDLWAMREAASGRAPPLWIGLKLFNVFGPNEYHKGEMMSLVAKNYRSIAAREPIYLFKSHRPDCADGEQRRDFIYAKDCAKVMSWLLLHGHESGVYNLGTGVARSFQDMMVALGNACGVEPIIEYVDMPPSIRSNYQYFTQATVEKLRRAGYGEMFTSLEEAVSDYVKSYLATSDRYL
jgi:ADP-L-glycero-D-manno-heptose 6-epimerase